MPNAEYFRQYRKNGSQKDQAQKFRDVQHLCEGLLDGSVILSQFWRRLEELTDVKVRMRNE